MANYSYCCSFAVLTMNNLNPSVLDVPGEPTNGIIIDLLTAAEEACKDNPQLCVKHLLAAWFHQLYPSSPPITRPCRFEATARRIAAPTRPSTRGCASLAEEELREYRERAPKIRPSHDTSTGKIHN